MTVVNPGRMGCWRWYKLLKITRRDKKKEGRGGGGVKEEGEEAEEEEAEEEKEEEENKDKKTCFEISNAGRNIFISFSSAVKIISIIVQLYFSKL